MGTAPVNPLWDSVQFDQSTFGGSAAGMGCTSAMDLIYAALRKAGVTLGPGRTPSPAQQQDALSELRRLTGSLNSDRLFIYSMTTYTLPLTGAKTYTIGQDPCGGSAPADFNVPRPQLIDRANVISNTLPPIRYPLGIITDLQWARIRVQDIANAIPQVLYNDRGYPYSTLYLWGQPIAGYQLELFVWTQVPTFVQTSDEVALPLQYEDALVLNLACRLAPQFQRMVDPDLRQQARESLMRLESINAPRPTLDIECGTRGGYMNVYSGQVY